MKESIGTAAVNHIALSLSKIDNHFPSAEFMRLSLQGLDQLELKQRVNHLIAGLHQCLPKQFCQAAQILEQIPNVWTTAQGWQSINAFAAWPLIDYVGVHGLDEPDIALPLLKRLTRLFSAEFAIRHFIIAHPQKTMNYLNSWLDDKDEHVRRLVSEGSRPRLPWGIQLTAFIQDPQPTIPLLEVLKSDESLYVRRSVANHLNDVSKDHPLRVIELCQDWLPKATKNEKWLIKHATRSLVKAGIPAVFPLLGFAANISIEPITLQIKTQHVRLGEYLQFELFIRSNSTQSQNLVVDFAIHFVKANGQTKAKVFKLKNMTLLAHQSRNISKSHAIKPITTRQYYAGKHQLEILINGQSQLIQDFELYL